MANKLAIAPRRGRRPKASQTIMQHGSDRSETVTVRFTPRERYLLELMARAQHRTVSSVVSWAVDQAMEASELQRRPDIPVSLLDVADTLWHPDETTRLDILARMFPALLTMDEHVLWLAHQKENGHE